MEIPEAWNDFFARRGPTPTKAGDKRHCPRFHFRARAALEVRQSLPELPREHVWYCIYTKDLSRESVAFLHSEQLFPCERLRIWLPGDLERACEVVRRMRHADRCFEIGARFIGLEHLAE